MSLSLKYLVPLNLVIIVVWTIHLVSSQVALEEVMLATEKEAMEQLAYSVKLQLESVLAGGEKIDAVAGAVKALTRRWPGLDVMVIDNGFSVRLASDRTRIGRRWYEAGIESVLRDGTATTWNMGDHAHAGRRAIDVSVAVVGPDGEVSFVVHIAKWLDRLLDALHRQRRHNLLSALGELIAVAIAVNLLTLLLVLRPLQRIQRQIGASAWLEDHPRPTTRNEIRRLGIVVSSLLAQVQVGTDRLRSTLGDKESALKEIAAHRDHLVDRVERVAGALANAEARLVRAERIAAMAQLSGALAHELRNPLHLIRATAETAASRSPEIADLAADIMEEVDRINSLITKLLAFTRSSDLNRQSIDLRELLNQLRRRMCLGFCQCDPDDCSLCRFKVGEGAETIDADPVLLEQAILNLWTNAREMSPKGAKVEIQAISDGDGEIVLSVADRGAGIAEKDRERVFEPFFTRKTTGAGLGLPTVQKIADLHEGSIELLPRDGGGTIAILRLPALKIEVNRE